MSRPVFRTGRSQGRDLVAQWISTPSLRTLVELDGGTWPDATLDEVVPSLASFVERWDLRRGRSRLLFHDYPEARSDDRALATYAAARELGLIDSAPPTERKYDYVAILGGLATGVAARVRYAAHLVADGDVSAGSVVGLGSFRVLESRERPTAEQYAPDARYEVDLLVAMMDREFRTTAVWRDAGVGDPAVDPARAESVRRNPGPPDLAAYAARSSDPAERPANTVDTYLQFARDAFPTVGQSLLLVTSSIYRPYQHMDAVRALGDRGVMIETVGVPLPPTVGSNERPPSAYLQEIRSGVRAAAALLAADPHTTG